MQALLQYADDLAFWWRVFVACYASMLRCPLRNREELLQACKECRYGCLCFAHQTSATAYVFGRRHIPGIAPQSCIPTLFSVSRVAPLQDRSSTMKFCTLPSHCSLQCCSGRAIGVHFPTRVLPNGHQQILDASCLQLALTCRLYLRDPILHQEH